jgi:hypothetical protein
MRVPQAKGEERGRLSWPRGDDQAFDKSAASIGAEVCRTDRFRDQPIPAKGA